MFWNNQDVVFPILNGWLLKPFYIPGFSPCLAGKDIGQG